MQRMIYAVTHIATGRQYVGCSINGARRWRQHSVRLNNGVHPNARLQEDWSHYGQNAFQFAIIEDATGKDLHACEQAWIEKLQPYYNTQHVSKEERQKRQPPPVKNLMPATPAELRKLIAEVVAEELTKRGIT